MKRIVHITTVHPYNDPRIFYKECLSLSSSEYEVILIAPSNFEERIVDGVRVIGIPPPQSRLLRTVSWIQVIKKTIFLKPDFIHFHDPELLFVVVILRLALGRNVCIVYDIHEYFVDSIADKVWIAPYLRKTIAWLARILEQILGNVVDGLIFVVEDQVPLYKSWKKPYVIVHNYPSSSHFSNPTTKPHIPSNRFRLIYLGAIYARRGIMTMLEALKLVVPQAPDTLLILGGSYESSEFKKQVDGYISGNYLNEHVACLGRIDYKSIKDYLAHADVAWLPGLSIKQYKRRSISTKQLESMLMGLPIITSDHPHRRFFIEEARCGLSVTANDPRAHAEAVIWMHDHPDERRAMGQRGRQLVLDKYSWSTEQTALLAFYNKLLKSEE